MVQDVTCGATTQALRRRQTGLADDLTKDSADRPIPHPRLSRTFLQKQRQSRSAEVSLTAAVING